jgi:hypothetical protein
MSRENLFEAGPPVVHDHRATGPYRAVERPAADPMPRRPRDRAAATDGVSSHAGYGPSRNCRSASALDTAFQSDGRRR